jgi:hypothetical protein
MNSLCRQATLKATLEPTAIHLGRNPARVIAKVNGLLSDVIRPMLVPTCNGMVVIGGGDSSYSKSHVTAIRAKV